MNHLKHALLLSVLSVMLSAPTVNAGSVGTAITFGGYLTEDGYSAGGIYDFTFKLFDDALSGSQTGSTVTVSDVNAVNGSYSVEIDFGDIFNGQELWLSTEVLKQGDSTPETLSPRQKLTPVAYSLFALKSGAPWKAGTSSSIYYNQGKVGIGKTNPVFDLDVNGALKLQSGNPVSDISNDPTMSNNSPSKLVTQQAIKGYVDSRLAELSASIVGVVPVGAVVAWHKSFPNTPALPSSFVECNGQTINDSDSPYNGQTAPDLNGLVQDSGIVSSAGGNTLADSSKAWEASRWAGYICEIVSGAGAGQARKVISNSSNTLTFEGGDWATIPNSSSAYEIHAGRRFLRGNTVSGGNGLGGGPWHRLTVNEMPSHTHTTIQHETSPSGEGFDGSGGGSRDTGATGGNDIFDNRPPFYEIVWIMRIK